MNFAYLVCSIIICIFYTFFPPFAHKIIMNIQMGFFLLGEKNTVHVNNNAFFIAVDA